VLAVLPRLAIGFTSCGTTPWFSGAIRWQQSMQQAVASAPWSSTAILGECAFLPHGRFGGTHCLGFLATIPGLRLSAALVVFPVQSKSDDRRTSRKAGLGELLEAACGKQGEPRREISPN